jgi:predicted component of type VI protein secretion system
LDDGPSILLDKPILLLGRHPECDIQIDSRKISRRHCCIAQVDNFFVVRDLGSTNGVRINGVRVLEGRLNDGDELTIGTTRYQVTWEASAVNGAGRKAPPVGRPGAPPPVEDDLLESSDEPVPLPDPERARPFDPSRPVKLDEALDEPDGPASPVLPADLDLLPVSHANLPAPAPSAEPNPSV